MVLFNLHTVFLCSTCTCLIHIVILVVIISLSLFAKRCCKYVLYTMIIIWYKYVPVSCMTVRQHWIVSPINLALLYKCLWCLSSTFKCGQSNVFSNAAQAGVVMFQTALCLAQCLWGSENNKRESSRYQTTMIPSKLWTKLYELHRWHRI